MHDGQFVHGGDALNTHAPPPSLRAHAKQSRVSPLIQSGLLRRCRSSQRRLLLLSSFRARASACPGMTRLAGQRSASDVPTVLPVCVMVGTRSLSSGARARGPVALPTLRGISSFSHHCIITFLARPPMSGNRRAQARALTKEGSPVMHISRSSTSISKMRPNSSTSISAKNWRQHSVPSFRQTQARANDHRRPAVKPPAASRRATTASCGGPPTMRRALAARRDRRCRKGRAGSAPRPRGSMAASTSTMRRPLIAAMARIHCLMIAVPGPRRVPVRRSVIRVTAMFQGVTSRACARRMTCTAQQMRNFGRMSW